MAKTESVNIKELLSSVDFSAEEVVDAAAKNTGLFVKAINYRMECLEEKTSAKAAHEEIKAGTELKIRKEYRASGEKITEANIEALVLLNPKVKEIAKRRDRAEAYDVYSGLVVEVFRMRRDCLRIVESMAHDEYFMARAAEEASRKSERMKSDVRAKFPADFSSDPDDFS